MKRTHKKVLGFFGLVAVVAITALAASIPAPKTQATTSSVTDTIVVRVVGSQTNVYITGPEEGTVFTGPTQTVEYNYEHTERVSIIIEYIDEEGTVHSIEVESFETPDEYGNGSTTINFSNYNLGYGDYVIKVIGEGKDGAPHEATRSVSYLPVTATVEEDAKTGDANVKLDYDENDGDIDKIKIEVYDENGNLIEELSPIIVEKPTKDVTIPFSETDLPGGKYIIKVTALDANGNPLHDAYELVFEYKPKDEPVPVPNTGGLFAGTNISQTDYLISGLLVFFIAGVLGTVFVARGNKSQKKRR